VSQRRECYIEFGHTSEDRIRNTTIGENIGMAPIVVMFCDIYEVSCLVTYIFNDPSYATE
jgi:hypothetical protein